MRDEAVGKALSVANPLPATMRHARSLKQPSTSNSKADRGGANSTVHDGGLGISETATPQAVALSSTPTAPQRAVCYLLFNEASGGSIIAHWSTSPVEGALAMYSPIAAPPAFKLKQVIDWSIER